MPALSNLIDKFLRRATLSDADKLALREDLGIREPITPTGLVSDARRRDNGVVSGTSLTSVGANFPALSGANNFIRIEGAGLNGLDHVTTIASVTNSTTIVLTDAAPTAIASNAVFFFGTDNTAAYAAAVTAARAARATATDTVTIAMPAGRYLGNWKLFNHMVLRGVGAGNVHANVLADGNLIIFAATSTILLPAQSDPVIDYDESGQADSNCSGTALYNLSIQGSASRRGYGVRLGDAGSTFTGTMANGSTTVTSLQSVFLASHVGRQIEIPGAGAAGARLKTTIATYVSPTQITLAASNTSGSAVTNQLCAFGGANGYFGLMIKMSNCWIAGFKYLYGATRVTELDLLNNHLSDGKYGYNLAEIEEVDTLHYTDAVVITNIASVQVETVVKCSGSKGVVIISGNLNGVRTPATGMVSGQQYYIAVVGTTPFTSLGAASNTVGLLFTYNGTAVTGDGFIQRSDDFKRALDATNSQVTIHTLNNESPASYVYKKDGGNLTVLNSKVLYGLGGLVADVHASSNPGTTHIVNAELVANGYANQGISYAKRTSNLRMPSLLPKATVAIVADDTDFRTVLDFDYASWLYSVGRNAQLATIEDHFLTNRTTGGPIGQYGWTGSSINSGSGFRVWDAEGWSYYNTNQGGGTPTGRFSLPLEISAINETCELIWSLRDLENGNANCVMRIGFYSHDAQLKPVDGFGFLVDRAQNATNILLEKINNSVSTVVDTGVLITAFGVTNRDFVLRSSGTSLYGTIRAFNSPNGNGAPLATVFNGGTLRGELGAPAIVLGCTNASNYGVAFKRVKFTKFGDVIF